MFSANLAKGLTVAVILLLLVGCGGKAKKGGGGGRSTAPSEEQLIRLEDARTAAETAENAYFQRRLERIELERQLEDQ